jgi:hypothetical protein
MKKVYFFAVLAVGFFSSGCGLVSLFGTPGPDKTKIPAEYNLAEREGQKILVLVNQPYWLDSKANLRYYLTDAINLNLAAIIRIPSNQLISYNKVTEFRSERGDFSSLSPVDIGKALDANTVLLVNIENYQLKELPEAGYCKGNLDASVSLLDTATGDKIWPRDAKGRNIKIGFDVENRGQEAAAKRLVAGCAYCAVRYFYDCPKSKFKVADEEQDLGWEKRNE